MATEGDNGDARREGCRPSSSSRKLGRGQPSHSGLCASGPVTQHTLSGFPRGKKSRRTGQTSGLHSGLAGILEESECGFKTSTVSAQGRMEMRTACRMGEPPSRRGDSRNQKEPLVSKATVRMLPPGLGRAQPHSRGALRRRWRPQPFSRQALNYGAPASASSGAGMTRGATAPR